MANSNYLDEVKVRFDCEVLVGSGVCVILLGSSGVDWHSAAFPGLFFSHVTLVAFTI